MANLKVTLVRLCKTPEGWRRYPAVIAKNGQVKPDYALVRGKAVQYPEGRYQLRSYEGARMVYKDVGLHAAEALTAQRQKANVLRIKSEANDANANGANIKLVEEDSDRLTLAAAMKKFITATEDRGSMEMARQYRYTLPRFIASCAKTYVDELTDSDALHYAAVLRREQLSDRTINTRYKLVRYFYIGLGFDAKKVKEFAGKAPRVEKTLPECYTEEEMGKFFAAEKDPQRHVAFEILWKCGLRDQELCNLEWSNVDLTRGILRIRANRRTGFRVKDGESRDVTIPEDLLGRMRAFREAHPQAILVLGTDDHRPHATLLHVLKRAARRAGLHCGTCTGCLSRYHECERWWLHKFRSTYITKLLRAGMDIRTVMKLSGHSSMAAIMRYIVPAGDESVRAQVNAVKWT